jgi:hypothetical protein
VFPPVFPTECRRCHWASTQVPSSGFPVSLYPSESPSNNRMELISWLASQFSVWCRNGDLGDMWVGKDAELGWRGSSVWKEGTVEAGLAQCGALLWRASPLKGQ